MHDRYACYDHFDGIRHQLCTARILRDIKDAAQSYPDAICPGQIARELRALIHQANRARDAGLPAVPADATTGHLRMFRHGVNAGLSQVRRVPGSNTKQPPALHLLECLKHAPCPLRARPGSQSRTPTVTHRPAFMPADLRRCRSGVCRRVPPEHRSRVRVAVGAQCI